jgi:hypothetical protein
MCRSADQIALEGGVLGRQVAGESRLPVGSTLREWTDQIVIKGAPEWQDDLRILLRLHFAGNGRWKVVMSVPSHAVPVVNVDLPWG